MKIILESIRGVLSEGRVEDIKKKFPNLDPKIIDYFVQNDPSGNQKYLEWMVKAISHKPTTQSIGNILNDNSFEDGYWGGTAALISGLVNKFHRLLPYMVYTEDGVKQGTTDLYQYKFTDSEMINYLIFDLEWAEERKHRKEKEKELKKGIDKIYNDNNWLVLRPKTWEASCHYGAGTKWCTTSRETDRHFERETDRKSLIYVINKNLPPDNTRYKVAWQIPYVKKLDKILTDTSVDFGRVKFWDAEDNPMNSQIANDYFLSIPEHIRKLIFSYVQNQINSFYENIGYSDDPNIQALIENLGISDEEKDSIYELPWTNFGMKVYEYDGDGYSVANESQLDNAIGMWANDFLDNHGSSEAIDIVGGEWSRYVYVTDPEGIARELSDSYVEDMDEEDFLFDAGRYKNTKELLEDYQISSTVVTDLQEEENELDEKIANEEITATEYSSELERIHKEWKELNTYLENKIKEIKKLLADNYYRNYYEEITDNPVRWLRDFGWWEDNRPIPKALSNDIVSIDEDALLSDLEEILDVEYFSSTGNYETIRIEGERYYIFPTDI